MNKLIVETFDAKKIGCYVLGLVLARERASWKFSRTDDYPSGPF